MAIQEVVDWDIAPRPNLAHHPTGPQGEKATRTSLSFQELQAAIARWRDTLGGGGTAWGSITGTLSAQTDLQAALDLKAPIASPVFTGSVIILGTMEFDSDQTIGAGQDNYVLTYDNGDGQISLEAGTWGELQTDSANNLFAGQDAGFSLTFGSASNILLGEAAGKNISACDDNIIFGASAGFKLESGFGHNLMMGNFTGDSITTGFYNVFLGRNAGTNFDTSSERNVALGQSAGPSSLTVEDNQLYIHNANGVPLIGGDFSTGLTTFSGALQLTERADHIGTFPDATFGEVWIRSDSPNNLIYTDDVGTDHVLNATAGDVSKVGTPVNDEIGVWTGDGTLEGDTNFTWGGSNGTLTVKDATVPMIVLESASSVTTKQIRWSDPSGVVGWIYNSSAGNTNHWEILRDNGTFVVLAGIIMHGNTGAGTDGSIRIRTGNGTATAVDNVTFEGTTGALVADFSSQIQVAPSVAAQSGLRIEEGVAPTIPVDGDTWVTAAGEFNARLNGVTVDLASGSGDVTAGTQADNQVAVWNATAKQIEGTTGLTYNGTALNITGNITLTGTVDSIDIATDVAANTLKNTNVPTALSVGTVGVNTVAITSDGGADDVTLPAATVAAAGMLTTAKWGEIVANTAKAANVSTALSVGTVGVNTVAITSDGGADDVTLPAATVSAAGMLTTAKWAEIVANTAKATNVPTALSAGTVTATTYGITSDSGADDIVLPEATTLVAGLLGADKWDEIVANTAKVTNATHTGQVTGATALALDVTAITAQPASGAIVAADTIITNDGGVLSEATFTQMDTYFNSSLSFGAGDVSKVGTPVNNEVAVWTGDGTLEGESNMVFSNGGAFTLGVTAGGELRSGAGQTLFIGTGAGGSALTISGATNAAGIGGAINMSGGGGTSAGGNVTIEGGDATASAFGGDIILRPGKGTSGSPGSIQISPQPAGIQDPIVVEFREDAANGADWVGLVAPVSITTNRTWTLPQDDPSTAAGQFLTTDASGILSFAAAGDVTAGTQANDQVAIWNATAKQIEGDAGLTFNGSLDQLTVGDGTAILTNLAINSSSIGSPVLNLSQAGTVKSSIKWDHSTTGLWIDSDAEIILYASNTQAVRILTGSITVGPNNTTGFGFQRLSNTGILTMSGGNSTFAGADLVLYSGAHSSFAGDFFLRSVTDTIINWDKSAGTLVFDAGATPTTNLTLSGNAGSELATFAGAVTAVGGIDKLTTATGVVSVAAAAAPSVGQTLVATSATVATWQTPAAGSLWTYTLQTGTTYTAVAGDFVVASNTGTVTITLPTPAVNDTIIVKKTGATGTVTVDGAGAHTIDGIANFALSAQYASVTLIADTTSSWLIV